MKYKSKVDWWYILFVLVFSYCTFHVGYTYVIASELGDYKLLVALFFVCEFLFLLPNLCCTCYVLDEHAIHVRSGLFYYRSIAFDDIVKIRETKAIFAAGGLALDRIEITYKHKDSIDAVLISPKEKETVKCMLDENVKARVVKDLAHFAKSMDMDDHQPINGIIHP